METKKYIYIYMDQLKCEWIKKEIEQMDLGEG